MARSTSNADVIRAIDPLVDSLFAAFSGKPDGVYWVSVDMITVPRAISVCREQFEDFADGVARTLLERLGPRATVLVSAFNFQFPQRHVFDVRESAVQTGAFGGLLLRRHARLRTPQPFYSFFAFGARAIELMSGPLPSNTGTNSVFQWIMDREADLLTIGHHYVKSLTSVHHAEDVAGVSYRYRKSFSGKVVRSDGTVGPATSTFLVRKIGTCDFSALTLDGDAHLRASGIVETAALQVGREPIVAQKVDLARCHEVLVADLLTETPRFVDYYGPNRENRGVITPPTANAMYIATLKAVKSQGRWHAA